MRIIGITGGIGSGKSTASAYIRGLGYDVIDADELAKEFASDPDVLDEIRDFFGDDVIAADGSLDRKRMAGIVFADIQKRELLENIITSKVIKTATELISDYREGRLKATKGDVVFLDAPTLFETGSDRLVDEVWLVTCDMEKRLERTEQRDGASREDLEARIAAQMSEDEKIERADVVIYNNGTMQELYDSIDSLLK